MFGSYNQFHARVHIDAHIVSIIDFMTSLIASVVIFSTLGHQAHLLGVPVETVAKGSRVSYIKFMFYSYYFQVARAWLLLPIQRPCPTSLSHTCGQLYSS